MGLDIAFSRSKAVAAGIKLTKSCNGTAAQIREAIAMAGESDGYMDHSYVDYLSRENTLIEVPYSDHYVQDDGTKAEIVVRANRWGSTYAPLTQWLKENDITWTEF